MRRGDTFTNYLLIYHVVSYGSFTRVIEKRLHMYDHTLWKTRDPVRSPTDKPERAKLVVGSVTTSESLVLYILLFLSR